MYEINFAAMKSSAEHLQNIVNDLKKEIEELNSIEKELMNENVWKGPKRSEYVSNFHKYQNALGELYTNAAQHLQVLCEEMPIYMKPEQ